jgi:hypothetical protein
VFISVCIHVMATHGTQLTASADDQLHTCLYAQRTCKVLLAAEDYIHSLFSSLTTTGTGLIISCITLRCYLSVVNHISPPRHHPSYNGTATSQKVPCYISNSM